MKGPSKGCLVGIACFIAVIFVAVSGIFILSASDSSKPSQASLALPKGATKIHEHYEDSFLPPGEFLRILKARIPEDEVHAYAQRVGAIKTESGQTAKDYFSWHRGPDCPEWFNPKQPALYYHYEQQYRIIVGWEDGYVYFEARAW